MRPRRQELWKLLIEATLESIYARGYSETTVSDITELAGISRTQFYFLFQDKQECFLALQAAIFGELEERLCKQLDTGRPWPEQIRAVVDGLMEAFDEQPALATVVLVESPLAEAAARERHGEAIAELLQLIEGGLRHVPEDRALPSSVGEMALGSAVAVLTKELRGNGPPSFRALGSQVYYALLMPFFGPIEAMEQTRQTYTETPPLAQLSS